MSEYPRHEVEPPAYATIRAFLTRDTMTGVEIIARFIEPSSEAFHFAMALALASSDLMRTAYKGRPGDADDLCELHLSFAVRAAVEAYEAARGPVA